jgi:hypothetical protein
MMPSNLVTHPSLLSAELKLTRSNNTYNNIYKARLSKLILSKT